MRIKFELHLSPDIWEGPVNVKISQYDIPTMVDWYCGDTHQHTNYTDNAVETGAPIYATRAANNAMGLDWMIVTDHSFDFDPDKWNVSSAECDAHSDNLFRVLQGEEVSCYIPGTAPHQYYHLLVYNANFIPGGEWEAIGSNTTSGYNAEEAISIANSQGGFTYTAHPMYSDGVRIPWRDEDYDLPFTGLQIWNHLSDEPTHLPDGLAKWSELLLGGRHVYVEGGTDAHGDFNTHSGKVKTYVHVPGYSQNSLPPRSEILNALRNGHSVMTDGPLVIFDINGGMIGNNISLTNGTNATLRILWNSTQEFGYINNITVKKGVINGTAETNFTIIQPSSIGKNTLCDEHELIISPNESCYYRVEANSNTTNGEQYRCYPNPIWVDAVNDTTPPVVTIITPVNGSIVSTPNVTLTGCATDDVGIVSVCYAQCYEKICGGSCDYPSNASTNVSFNWTVSLQEGENIITVTAYDAAGNSGNASVVVTLFKPAIAIEAEKCKLAKFEWDTLTVMGISTHNITIDSSDSAHTIFPMGIGDNPFTVSIPFNDTIDSDGIRTYTVYFNDTGTYIIKVTDTDAGIEDTVNLSVSGGAFDTGEGTYPSISGNHTGTITPNQTLRISKLYTYPCPGTGGHTECAAISYSNGTIIAEAHWNGYVGDCHNISFNETFTLIENETYNYTIRTGSYPQIHHTDELEEVSGTITCEEFVDVNGKKYNNWIPAIKLFL